MPYALILFGLLLTIAGARGKQGDLFTLLKGDFTGNRSFIWWSISIVGIGALGYIPTTKKLANTFLALVFIVLILSNRGVFAQFTAAIKSGPASDPANDNSQPNPLSGATDVLKTGKDLLSSALSFGQKLGVA